MPSQTMRLSNLNFYILVLVFWILQLSWLSSIYSQQTENDWTNQIIVNYDEYEPTRRLWDGSFPDFYINGCPGEVDWADRKWMEAFGQAAWYAKASNSPRAYIILLVKDMEDERDHLMRVTALSNDLRYNGKPFIIRIYDCKKEQFDETWSNP